MNHVSGARLAGIEIGEAVCFIKFGAPIRGCRDIVSYIQFVSLCLIWTQRYPYQGLLGHVILKVGWEPASTILSPMGPT